VQQVVGKRGGDDNGAGRHLPENDPFHKGQTSRHRTSTNSWNMSGTKANPPPKASESMRINSAARLKPLVAGKLLKQFTGSSSNIHRQRPQ